MSRIFQKWHVDLYTLDNTILSEAEWFCNFRQFGFKKNDGYFFSIRRVFRTHVKHHVCACQCHPSLCQWPNSIKLLGTPRSRLFSLGHLTVLVILITITILILIIFIIKSLWFPPLFVPVTHYSIKLPDAQDVSVWPALTLFLSDSFLFISINNRFCTF